MVTSKNIYSDGYALMTYTAKPGVRLFRHLDEQVEVTNPDVKTHQIDGLTVTEWPIKQPHKSLND